MLKKVFCLPPLWTGIAALFGYGFVLAVAVYRIQNPALQYASYLASAYALIVTVTGLISVHRAVGDIKTFVSEHALMKKFRATAVGEKYMTDVRFRAGVSLGRGLLVSLLYIGMKLVSGIYYRSAWFLALAGYYALLALLRLLLLRSMGVQDEAEAFRRYRLCGIVLLIMNQALAVLVVFMVHQNKGFAYPGMLIYAMAVYAFYSIIVAIVNVVKMRKQNSPILSAAKAISLVTAMVSILALETAMLAQFGGNDGPQFRQMMTSATGGVVCTVVIGMAIYMIRRANQNLKKLTINDSQTAGC